MTRPIFTILLWVFFAPRLLIGQAPQTPWQPAANPYGQLGLEDDELTEAKRRYTQLRSRLRDEKDEKERDQLGINLRDMMEAIFELDFERRESQLQKLETQVAKLRASQDKRKSQRDRIIKAKLEQILLNSDGPEFLDDSGEFHVNRPIYSGVPVRKAKADIAQLPERILPDPKVKLISDKTENGVRKVRVKAWSFSKQQRTREVPYTVTVPQTRVRTVAGKEQAYTVMVAEQRTRTENYTVIVPVTWENTIEIPKGEDWEEAVKRQLKID